MPRTADLADGGIVAIAPAKVNLFLELLARRPDGFHTLDTDGGRQPGRPNYCHARRRTDPDLRRSDAAHRADNLVVCAATACWHGRPGSHPGPGYPWRMHPRGGRPGRRLQRRGRHAVALNRLWNLGLSCERLRDIAATVGSDAGVFPRPTGRVVYGSGRSGRTRQAGRSVTFRPRLPGRGYLHGRGLPPVCRTGGPAVRPRRPRAAFASGDIDAIGKELFNRLQEPAERICPRVGELRERLCVPRRPV